MFNENEHDGIITRAKRRLAELNLPAPDHSTTLINDYELIFLTVHYDCGHIMCRPIHRINASFDQLANNNRDIFSPADCNLCVQMQVQKYGGR